MVAQKHSSQLIAVMYNKRMRGYMMKFKWFLSYLSLISIVFSVLPLARPTPAQDLIASEDIAGGSSVFVFRVSRKQPQSRMMGGRVRVGTGRTKASRGNAQIASAIASA